VFFCTEEACFLSSAVPKLVVESGAFETPVCNYIVLQIAD